jgi:hypothetical protein
MKNQDPNETESQKPWRKNLEDINKWLNFPTANFTRGEK